MSFGKSLKKGFKKAKKSTKKAVDKASKATKDAANKTTNVAKDAANKTADAVTGAANTVAHGVIHEAQELGQQVEKLTHDTAQLAERAYSDALAAGEATWNEFVELSEQFLTDALSDIAEAMAEDVYRKHLKLLQVMAESGYELLTDPSTYKDVQRLLDMAARKQRDEDTTRTVNSLAKSKAMQRVAHEAQGKSLFSLSIGAGGSATFGAGAEGCIGLAFDHRDQKPMRGFFGVGGVAGFTAGTSMNLQLAAWTDPPSDLAGPYMAVALEDELLVGVGVQVIFKMPATEKAWKQLTTSWKPELAGIVVALSRSADLSACVSCGYTWVY